jgi:hypothetical protein
MAFCRKRYDLAPFPQNPWLTANARDFPGQVCWCLPIRQMSTDAWMKLKSKRSASIDVGMRQR